MSPAMIDVIMAWLPLALILAVIVFVLMIARRQHKSYSSHLAEVTRINEENRVLGRENHEIARQSLIVLKEIKTLLEDRKP
jgi:hypothetical protein